jgi:hypothetical protein
MGLVGLGWESVRVYNKVEINLYQNLYPAIPRINMELNYTVKKRP